LPPSHPSTSLAGSFCFLSQFSDFDYPQIFNLDFEFWDWMQAVAGFGEQGLFD
jgi:hypothetical protein